MSESPDILSKAGSMKQAGQDEPASAKEIPNANPTTFGEPTHETPLGHFMDDRPVTTDGDRFVDEALTYIEAEHPTELATQYHKGAFIITNCETETQIAEIRAANDKVQVVPLVGGGNPVDLDDSTAVVSMLLELKDLEVEAPVFDAFEDFQAPLVEDMPEPEEMFGARASFVGRLLANTETLASAPGGEGDTGSAYNVIHEGRNFTGVDETNVKETVAEYLDGKACSFASLEDFAGFVEDVYGIDRQASLSTIAEAWNDDDGKTIASFITKNATRDILG